jgi:hypothetical protein
MIAKILVLLNYFYKNGQIRKMSKLQICVITNICNPIFVTVGRIGTWLATSRTQSLLKNLCMKETDYIFSPQGSRIWRSSFFCLADTCKVRSPPAVGTLSLFPLPSCQFSSGQHQADMAFCFIPGAAPYSNPDWMGLHRHPIRDCHRYNLNIC